MQLHPHFLFNTLNSILPLVFRDGEAAARTVVRLADLLRLSLQNEASDLIPLRRELELLRGLPRDPADALPGPADRAPRRRAGHRATRWCRTSSCSRSSRTPSSTASPPGPEPARIEVQRPARRARPPRASLVRDDGPGPPEGGRRGGGEGVGPAQHARPPRAALRRRPRVRFPRRAGPRLRGSRCLFAFPLVRIAPAAARTAAPRGGARLRRADGDPAHERRASASSRSRSPRRSSRGDRRRADRRKPRLRPRDRAIAGDARPGAAALPRHGRRGRRRRRDRLVDRLRFRRRGPAAAGLALDAVPHLRGRDAADGDGHGAPGRARAASTSTLPSSATCRACRTAASCRHRPRRSRPTCRAPRDFERRRRDPAPVLRGAATPLRSLPPAALRAAGRPGATPMSRPGYLLLSAALESASGKSVRGPARRDGRRPRRHEPPPWSTTRAASCPAASLFYERGWFGLLRAAHAVDTSCRWGAGGLLSTTEDLVRFGAALLRGELLRRETLDAMFTPQKTRNGVRDRLRPRLARQDRRARAAATSGTAAAASAAAPRSSSSRTRAW